MSPVKKISVIFGTRPEAVKLFPVVHAIQQNDSAQCSVIVSAQHREMLDQVLEISQIHPQHDLDVMQADQSLDILTSRLLEKIGEVLDIEKPDRVVVQGDTATAMVGALSAYYRKIPVSHVEAGLRSYDIYHPWPEEVNRKIIGTIADQHFAPTENSADALRKENIPEGQIIVTGNTVIDALHITLNRIKSEPMTNKDLEELFQKFSGKKIIGVTSHRRENFGEGLSNIANALREIASRPDVALIFPVHPNPNVRQIMESALSDLDNVALIEPLDYPSFVSLLDACSFMLTDSGGVQEEAPALGKPVLVMRSTTERPEGVEAGTAKLVGVDKVKIVNACFELLDNREIYQKMSTAHNPFGDGQASDRIAKALITDI